MASHSVSRLFLIVTLALAATILVFGRQYYASSIDLAWHFTLARNIAENWTWPHGDAYLAEMGSYPPAAHTIAAVLGAFLGSTMLGLTTTALLAVAGVYILLLSLMRFKRPDVTVLTFIIFCGLVVLFSRRHLVFGGEIIGNFFFAHIVGVCFSIGTFLIISGCKNPIQQALLAICGTYLLGWMFPLAQVYLASSIFCFMALKGLENIVRHRSIETPILASLVLLLVGLPLAIVEHPLFSLMSSIAQHNGAISGSLSAAPLMASALVLVAVAVILFILHCRGGLDLDNPIPFIALALAVASSAFLQWIVLKVAGRGSEYAVAKYSFAVVTLLIASISVLFGSLFKPTNTVFISKFSSLSQESLAVLTSFGLMFVLLPQGRTLKPLLDDLDFARHSLRYTLGDDAFGTAVAIDPRLTVLEQVAIANGEMRLPKESAIAFYLSQLQEIPAEIMEHFKAFLKNNPIKHAIIWSEAEPRASKSCIIADGGWASLQLVDYICYEKHQSYAIGTWIHTNRSSNGGPFLGDGWSTIEPWGVWSDGNEAAITFNLEDNASQSDFILEIEAIGYLPPMRPQQHVDVFAGEQPVGGWTISNSAPARYELRIPRSTVVKNRVQLRFSFLDAIQAKNDSRKLALGLIAFRLKN